MNLQGYKVHDGLEVVNPSGHAIVLVNKNTKELQIIEDFPGTNLETEAPAVERFREEYLPLNKELEDGVFYDVQFYGEKE